MGAGLHFASCERQSRESPRSGLAQFCFDSFTHSRDKLARSTDQRGTAVSLKFLTDLITPDSGQSSSK